MKRFGIFLIFVFIPFKSFANPLNCEVKSISPETSPNFLIPQITPPQVGETIDLDLEANEVSELHFSGGGAIPLVEVGATLLRVEGSSEAQAFFQGTHQSRTSVYTGSVLIYSWEDVSTAVIQIHRIQAFRGQSLYTMNLDCKVVE